MTKYFEGDTIRAEKNNRVVQGEISASGDKWYVFVSSEDLVPLANLEQEHYVITILKRSDAAVPTEDGLYLDATEDLWHVADGKIYFTDPIEWHASDKETAKDYAPFTRLVPAVDA